MKAKIYRYTCDFCGKQEITENHLHPENWATVINGEFPYNNEEFHFSSHECYEQYEKLHPDAIDCNASFYADDDWFNKKKVAE